MSLCLIVNVCYLYLWCVSLFDYVVSVCTCQIDDVFLSCTLLRSLGHSIKRIILHVIFFYIYLNCADMVTVVAAAVQEPNMTSDMSRKTDRLQVIWRLK